MKEESSVWLRQAERDLQSAQNSLESRDFYVASFLCQQVAEKALKALYIDEKGELLKTHNISKLGKELSVPDALLAGISELEPVYQETRYPDASSKIPSEEYSETDANDFLRTAHEVLEWVQNKLL